jgi:NADPH-dependent glutamate synthase beta subunit-like oxidoreductase
VLRFLLSPSRLVADAADAGAVGAVEFDVTRLEGAAEKQSAVATGEKELVRAGMVLRSIGYKSEPIAGVPFDARRSVVPNEQGRVVKGAGSAERERGLYVCGWLKRGPSGIIGTNITDARESVACVLADQAAGQLGAGAGGGAALRQLLASRGKGAASVIEWPAWLRIDAEERRRGAAAGKSREKLVDVTETVRLANGAA